MRAGLVGDIYSRSLQKTCVIISILPLRQVILGQISCFSAILFLSHLSYKVFAVSEAFLKEQIFKKFLPPETQQCKSFGKSWPSLGKPTWPSVLLSCRVTGEVIFCCMGLQINRHDKRDENETMVSRICRELLFQSAKAKCVQVHDS